MSKGWLEAFSDSDSVIMVLEPNLPHAAKYDDSMPLLAVFGSYVLGVHSVDIYWSQRQYGCYSAFHDSSSVEIADPA